MDEYDGGALRQAIARSDDLASAMVLTETILYGTGTNVQQLS